MFANNNNKLFSDHQQFCFGLEIIWLHTIELIIIFRSSFGMCNNGKWILSQFSILWHPLRLVVYSTHFFLCIYLYLHWFIFQILHLFYLPSLSSFDSSSSTTTSVPFIHLLSVPSSLISLCAIFLYPNRKSI